MKYPAPAPAAPNDTETNVKNTAPILILTLAALAGCAQYNNWTPAPADSSEPVGLLLLADFGADATTSGVPADVDTDDDFAFLDEELESATVEIADPIEKWNRGVFVVNDRLYFWVAKPVLEGYAKVVPAPVRTGMRNFFDNALTPVRAINALLQTDWNGAGVEAARFGINTTFGFLGVFDVAGQELDLPLVRTDLGVTLAVYGLGDGCYLVWPVMGPSTVRDTTGMVGDQFMNPLRYVDPLELSIGLSALRGVNNGSFRLGDYELLKSESLDAYVALRQAYAQNRARKVHDARLSWLRRHYPLRTPRCPF